MLDEQRKWIDRLEEQPVLFFRELNKLMRHSREALSQYVGAKPENITYVTNATYAVNVVAQAFAKNVLQPGDEILGTDQEYGACKRAWFEHAVSKGAVYVEAAIPIQVPSQEELLEIIWGKVTSKTKVLFVSHIASPTAVRFPVEELCARARKAGIISVIDGAHAPGQIDIDLATLEPDVYTGNLHKWMCTPKGSAFLWASDSLK